ncbi:MAG TPA: hypothetical protein VFE53_08280 [Mucilaginibacter sp.]|jgi:hypothetical protein|nr:hypothetical protein [Mucilaginibacter sp.]
METVIKNTNPNRDFNIGAQKALKFITTNFNSKSVRQDVTNSLSEIKVIKDNAKVDPHTLNEYIAV